MKTTVLCLLLLTSGAAFGADCEIFDTQGIIDAGGREVIIGSQIFLVRGGASRSFFKNQLLNCNMPLAATRFWQWRNSRRAVNWEVGLGLFVAWPVLVGIPFSAINAGTKKQQMIDAIRAGQ